MVKKQKKKLDKRTSPFKKDKVVGFRFVEYSLSQFVEVCKTIPSWGDLQNGMATVIVMTFILSQIRSYNVGVPGSEIDALPSVKWYRQHIVKSNWTLAMAAIISLTQTLDYINIAVPNVIESTAGQLVEEYKGNTRYIENVTTGNLKYFRQGIMSRVIGWLQSLPISNMGLLGIDPKKVGEYGLNEVVEIIGFGEVDGIKSYFNEYSEKGSLVFDENALNSEAAYGGRTKLEYEIFGDKISRSKPLDLKQSVGVGGIVQMGSINAPILNENLSPLEQVQYKAALKNGNQSKLKELTDIATQRHAEKLGSTNPNPGPLMAKDLKQIVTRTSVNKNSKKDTIMQGIAELNSELAEVIDMISTKRAILYEVYVKIKSDPTLSYDSLLSIDSLKLIKKIS